MKKKLIALFTSALLAIIACFSLVACGGKGIEGSWQCELEVEPSISVTYKYFYLEVKDGKVKERAIDTRRSSSEREYSGTYTLVEGYDNCYEIDWSAMPIGSITYIAIKDGKLLLGNSPDMDSSTAARVYSRTNQSYNEWQKEIRFG